MAQAQAECQASEQANQLLECKLQEAAAELNAARSEADTALRLSEKQKGQLADEIAEMREVSKPTAVLSQFSVL